MRRAMQWAPWLLAGLLLSAGCGARKPARGLQPHTERGMASWYGKKFHGRLTANGERYDMYAMTAAHKTLPFNVVVRVTNLLNGRTVEVRINDRGPFKKGRIIDLSYAAARELRMIGPGVVPVRIAVVDGGTSVLHHGEADENVGAKMNDAHVRCPARGCGTVFDVPAERLGRSTNCPSCGARMTARPTFVEALLREQERRIDGGGGAALPRLPLAVLVDNVRSLWNVGSMFRTADGCGVRELVLAGISGCPPRAAISKTALGAERSVRWRYQADALAALEGLREQGYIPVALENTRRAVAVDELAWPSPLCLVVGNEVAGVTPAVADACAMHVQIPMLGAKSTLNVAVAFGIAAFHASRSLAASAVSARVVGTER